MAITAKHFNRVASDIRTRIEPVEDLIAKTDPDAPGIPFLRGQMDGIRLVALDLAELFEQDNEDFNRQRFFNACGL